MQRQSQADHIIHQELLRLVKLERRLTSKILDLLQQLENDKSYLQWGYANLFDYLMRGLGYSESLAYQRTAALRLCIQLPEVKAKIDNGSLSLTTIARATKVLKTKTMEQKRSLLGELENKSGREVDRILARENPSEVKSPGPVKRYVNEHAVAVTLKFSEEEMQLLEKLKALKSHKIQSLKDLVVLLVEKELESYNRTSKLPSKSINPRQIKISLKNHLLQKAAYRCQFPGCNQSHFLQIDHIRPVRDGGGNRPENLQVLCQEHNRFKYLSQR